jgi:glycosyltransferase involved in cell wall biosynthesis
MRRQQATSSCAQTAPSPLRLGILVSHPIQYFVPVYRVVARDPRLDLTVLYRTRMGVDAYHDPGFGQTLKWDVPLLDGYNSEFLSDKTTLAGLESKVVPSLLRHRFDVLILHGYDRSTNLLALAVAKLMGTRVLVRGDTRLQPHHGHAPTAKRVFKRLVIRLFDGYLAIGSLNRDYYIALGASQERIHFSPFCVDNSAFALKGEAWESARAAFRANHGLPRDAVVVLFASKLIERKRPDDLIRAFSRVTPRYPDAWLVMVGSGEAEPAARALVAELALEQVRFVGFQNQSALPAVYAGSDLFVLPAEAEPWGLVVNEVMAAGLPVIISDDVGAAPDLVAGAGAGLVYPVGDVGALAEAMGQLLQDGLRRRAFGVRARQVIRDWDVDACAGALVDATLEVTRS